VAKLPKYATRESGDTVEMVERPHGGLSFVMADGQRSGKSAKAISNIATRKVIALLGEGARDGVAARAAHDYLFAMRGGKVRADLQMLSLDLQSDTIVITRNCETPVGLLQEGKLRWLDEEGQPIGLYRNTRPLIYEFPIRADVGVVLVSDGIQQAGKRGGTRLNLDEVLVPVLDDGVSARRLADTLLARAIEADGNFPKDDLTVLALYLHAQAQDEVRRLSATFPLS
jgi:serine phosphatase RsbU (regulator of sigma subunit)